jgi:pimeloyl-ACP methyl ester carboxylesterase
LTYTGAARQPGALTAMLNWYRGALWAPPTRPAHRRVEPPVRILWGLDDVALGADMAAASVERCRAAELFRLPGAGHWVQHEATEQVNGLLLDFLT